MRSRLEDLGRITVLVDNILDMELWERYTGRNKDFVDDFRNLNEEEGDELLHHLIYGIDLLKDRLYGIVAIAKGWDELNERVINEEDLIG